MGNTAKMAFETNNKCDFFYLDKQSLMSATWIIALMLGCCLVVRQEVKSINFSVTLKVYQALYVSTSIVSVSIFL